MSATRLIINADDFGMSHGITDGIITAHRYGCLTSTSLMANMPAAEYALTRLEKFPTLGIGVHLNICTGRPICFPTEVRSLVGADGRFHPPRVMIRRLWTGRVRSRELFAEFRAQIRWMKDRGVVPTHADSHHHMHLYPGAVRPFIHALKSEGIVCARAPRCVVWNTESGDSMANRLGGPHEGSLLRRAFVGTYRRALQLGAFRGFRMAAARVSFASRDRHDLDGLGEQWKVAFLNPQAGTFEFTCHPGLFEPGFSEKDAIHAQREAELRWLTSSDLHDAVDRSKIQLITYRELLDNRVAQPAVRHASAIP